MPGRLADFLGSNAAGAGVALIAGGGPLVDEIRRLDAVHGLGEELCHELALRALDVSASLLAGLLPGLALAESTDDLRALLRLGLRAVIVPRHFLAGEAEHAEPLPRTWATTSDAIAARIAEGIGASELVLLKSAPLPAGFGPEEATRSGLVDPVFPRAARRLARLSYVHLRAERPGRVPLA